MAGERSQSQGSSQSPSPPYNDGPQEGSKSGRKGKKKVGFSEDPRTLDDPFDDAARENTDGSPHETPEEPPSSTHEELSKDIHKLFGRKYVPRKPRPALRKSSGYQDPDPSSPSPQSPPMDSDRHQRSGIEAKERAERLAQSIKRHSTSGARKFSADLAAARDTDPNNPFQEQSDESGAKTADDSGMDTADESEGLANRRGSQKAAQKLVRSHTKTDFKSRRPSRYRPPKSGQVTPNRGDQDREENIPHPKTYQTGVLSSLLKLYAPETESKVESAAASPGRTPHHSPPESGPSTPRESGPSTPRQKPRKHLFGLLGNHSSSALAGLVGTTSMLATPGSGTISSEISETLTHDNPKQDHHKKSKKKKTGDLLGKAAKQAKPTKYDADKYKITIHIAEVMSRQRYLVKLCRALMLYGAPTHRLEEYLIMTSRVLEIEGQFLYIPGCMIISFDDSSTHTTEVKIVRANQGVNLGKLRDVHDIYKMIVHDKASVDEALFRLEEVFKRRPKFKSLIRIPVYGLASACVAPFAFQGRFIDLPIAFLLGCILGILQLVISPTNDLYANVFEITVALITSFLSRAFGSLKNGNLFCFSALAQASIALILPGYMVLCSSLELQSHNIVAGSVRMVYALIYTLFLGYGIMIGSVIYGAIDKNATSDTTCHDPMRKEWYFLFVPLFALCLCIINQAHWRQMPLMIFIAFCGYLANFYSAQYFIENAQVSNTLGALCIGVLANLYSRLGRHWDKVLRWAWKRAFKRQASLALDTESSSSPDTPNPGSPGSSEPRRPNRTWKVAYGLAAAAMLPAIFVQVPSGLAAGGSLLAGVTSADQLTENVTDSSTGGASDQMGGVNSGAFNVLYSVIQVAIGISVGLFLSALIVYPFGKRRSGLFSF
ncbi:DUF1212-domain-containing protein [Eremomyces bilateralis CBS 781.70]|uniref:DUF1212-domain-containing protein n=1 Tax=Eremomyces bilateralis CBS 781.70 TaxID=1392243 RepID=A0A6G1FQI0_9PEZI|nr:DUF1212-domain-containing protein [Eremomyces bilateralis CBS 781.70]KAF1807988.1 DUF1212-domain-containing protein [Eremomyces bilateralis CBS 781.70]